MVKRVFGIDSYKSKIGNDEEIVVLSFVVEQEDPAKDLENFIEMGYDFVLDADVTPGETDDGHYIVFVELERGRHLVEQILEIVDGISKLTGLDNMRFRYFKNFRSHDVNEKELVEFVPMDKESYVIATEKNKLDNFQEFFINSYADEIKLLDESISFKRHNGGVVKFKIVTSGNTSDVYNAVNGPIVLESRDMAEIMFLTKIIGNFNITKIGNNFIFENNGWAVALERKE